MSDSSHVPPHHGLPRLLGKVLAATALSATQPVMAEGSAPSEPVVAVVRVPKPWYAPRLLVEHRMRGTVEQYARLPGLAFKAYAFERRSGDFGGVYFWANRSSAEAWFNAAWHARVREERGVEAEVRLLAAPVSFDNTPGGTAADLRSTSVVTLLWSPLPRGVTRQQLIERFQSEATRERSLPGLLRKHFVIGPDGAPGGVYLWKDELSARAWLAAHRTSASSSTASPDALEPEWFDTPILLPSAAPGRAIDTARVDPEKR